MHSYPEATRFGLRSRSVACRISTQVDEDKLKKDFGKCGKITDIKLLLNDEGWSRGIAFVTSAPQCSRRKLLCGVQLDPRAQGGSAVSGKLLSYRSEKNVCAELRCLKFGEQGILGTCSTCCTIDVSVD